jgi:hypothetical protein
VKGRKLWKIFRKKEINREGYLETENLKQRTNSLGTKT